MAQEVDPLIAELNGDLPPLIDEAPPAAPDRQAELTVPAPPKPSAVQAADAQHATKAGGRGYRVFVKGEYYAQTPDGKGKIKKDYTAEFNVPKLEGAQSIIKNKMLKAYLTKKYPDFVADRTIYIERVEPLTPDTPPTNNIAYMNRDQLVAYVQYASPRPPIVPSIEEYPNVADLREAIIDFIQTPKGFMEREKARQERRKEDRELALLNPEIQVDSNAGQGSL